MITAGGIIAALVGLLTLGGAILAVGRWVGVREAKSRLEEERAVRVDRALEAVPRIETKVEHLERTFDRHISDHRQLASRVDDARDNARVAMASVHNKDDD